MDWKFERKRADSISADRIMMELTAVAHRLSFVEFGKREFDQHASVSSHTVIRHFRSWRRAVLNLKQTLAKQGITLKPRRAKFFSDMQLFEEMERIWKELGHRPSKVEWNSRNPRISFQTYCRYFEGWQNACLKFIEYKMEQPVQLGGQREDNRDISQKIATRRTTAEMKRDVPLRLRLDVLQRDLFRCVLCGRSPATNVGTKLHLDHLAPFSKGGKTIKDNLRNVVRGL